MESKPATYGKYVHQAKGEHRPHCLAKVTRSASHLCLDYVLADASISIRRGRLAESDLITHSGLKGYHLTELEVVHEVTIVSIVAPFRHHTCRQGLPRGILEIDGNIIWIVLSVAVPEHHHVDLYVIGNLDVNITAAAPKVRSVMIRVAIE